MTETGSAAGDWQEQLRGIARRTGHEVRNALNGLAVNIEVVRARLTAQNFAGPAVAPYATLAAEQADEVLRLNAATVALVQLLLGSLDAEGRIRCTPVPGPPAGLLFHTDDATAERLLPDLQALCAATGGRAEKERRGVILSVPPEPVGKSHETNDAIQNPDS